jgi:GntR family transcriptional regulator
VALVEAENPARVSMFFSIDADNGIAIYEQIVRQVKFAVANGVLVPGQLLPSVRTLAVKLAINPNTVAKAFQQLQSEGVVVPLRGKGLAVRDDAVQSCRIARREILEDRIRTAITEALHGGLSAKEVRRLVLDQIQELDGNVTTVSSPLEETEPV